MQFNTEDEEVAKEGYCAVGGIHGCVQQVNGEDRLKVYIEVRGGVYARLKAIADAVSACDGAPQIEPDYVLDRCLESFFYDLNVGGYWCTKYVLDEFRKGSSCSAGSELRLLETNKLWGRIKKAVLKLCDKGNENKADA